jgi:hypothetical protein
MTLARRGAQVAIRRSHHVSWQGDDDKAKQVNGYGPLGSFGVDMPTEMGGGEMAQYYRRRSVIWCSTPPFHPLFDL